VKALDHLGDISRWWRGAVALPERRSRSVPSLVPTANHPKGGAARGVAQRRAARCNAGGAGRRHPQSRLGCRSDRELSLVRREAIGSARLPAGHWAALSAPAWISGRRGPAACSGSARWQGCTLSCRRIAASDGPRTLPSAPERSGAGCKPAPAQARVSRRGQGRRRVGSSRRFSEIGGYAWRLNGETCSLLTTPLQIIARGLAAAQHVDRLPQPPYLRR
jgi:hypothetical protein